MSRPVSHRGFAIDDSELRTLGIDLGEAPLRIRLNSRKAMGESARLVNREMRIDAAGHVGNYFGIPGTEFVVPLPEHVSHDVEGPWDAEIGIESKGAGKLAHLLAYGSVNNAPVYDHTAALRRSESRIQGIFADAVEESALGKEH